MGPLALAKLGFKARKQFRKWRTRKRNRKLSGQERPVLKGKLTYTAVLGIVAPVLSAALGFEVVSADLVPFWQAALAGVALYGRWRANR